MDDLLLKLSDLVVEFHLESGWFPAVNGVDLCLQQGETLGIVGESGSGKTMMALSLINLLPKNGRIGSGEIYFNGIDMRRCSAKQLRNMRGQQISMIFQDPMSALDPVYTCGKQLEETIRAHSKLSKGEIREKCDQLFRQVGIWQPNTFLHAYPHELSGGMCQRVMIAMALALGPKLLIADEPTTALDVTIQAMILDLLKNLQADHNMSILLISHDLGVVADIADRVAVMYGGNIIEYGNTYEIFDHPQHPYTQGLIASIPQMGGDKKRLSCIEGTVPDIEHFPSGCRFCNRCPYANERCRTARPSMVGSGEHTVACWRVIGDGEV